MSFILYEVSSLSVGMYSLRSSQNYGMKPTRISKNSSEVPHSYQHTEIALDTISVELLHMMTFVEQICIESRGYENSEKCC